MSLEDCYLNQPFLKQNILILKTPPFDNRDFSYDIKEDLENYIVWPSVL